jgi:WD40 repeat protein/tRNA A-37 threonylcarbamoyl transferase component Bud32
MSENDSPTGSFAGSAPQLTVEQALLVDQACDAFEVKWQRGGWPDIGAALCELPEPIRPAALRELVALEIFYRRQRGETPAATDFAGRFPELDAIWLSQAVKGTDGRFDHTGPPPLEETAEHADRLKGEMLSGRYMLLEMIGRGGMGTVWAAQQTKPVKRRVAVKLIKAGLDSKAVVARFEAERQALALMDHPNIARIYDGGTTSSGQPYFVMELVQGVTITEFCDQKRLTLRARLELFVSVCHAVQHAHQKGVIHRDLKPGNVLVTEVDGRPTPKVIDFGVAKATEFRLTDQSLADAGAIVGTPAYMSPEQADPSSMDIDTRTDVYALGVILYELLVGSPPIDAKQFKRGAILEMLRIVREVDPPRPSTKLSGANALPSIASNRHLEPSQLKRALQGDLDWIVMKSLEKDRIRRYETANGFAADVLRHLAHEPVLAAPPSRAYRVRKFVRKNRGAAAGASLVLLALLSGMTGTTWGLIRAENQRVNADLARAAEAERVSERDTALGKADEALRKEAERVRERDAALGKADAARDTALRQLVKLDVMTATRHADRGEYDNALHWVARAWNDDLNRLKPGEPLDSSKEADHRLRVGSAIEQLPQLVGFCPHDRPVMDADCDATGDFAVSLANDRLVRVWATGLAELAYPPLKHEGLVTSAMFSPDGRKLATSSLDGTARLWDASTGELLTTYRPGFPVARVAFSPNGKALAVAAGGSVHCVDAANGKQIGEPISVGGLVDYVVYSPDGNRLAIIGDPENAPIRSIRPMRLARIWDIATRKCLGEVPHVRHAEVNSPANRSDFERMRWPKFSPDSRMFASDDGAHIHLWSAEQTRKIQVMSQPDSAYNQIKFDFTPDGRYFVYANRGPDFCIYDLRTNSIVKKVPLSRICTGLCVSPDGGQVAVSITNGETFLYALPGGAPFPGPHMRSQDNLTSLRFTANGKRLFIASADGTIRVWQRPGSQPIEQYQMDCGRADQFRTATQIFSSDGRWTAIFNPSTEQLSVGPVGGRVVPVPGLIQHWDVSLSDTGGGPQRRFAAQFSPCGRYLITGAQSVDGPGTAGRARVLEMTENGPKEVGSASIGFVYDFAFSADGRRVAASARSPGYAPGPVDGDVDQFVVWEMPNLVEAYRTSVKGADLYTGQLTLSRDGKLLFARRGSAWSVPGWNINEKRPIPGLRFPPGDILGMAIRAVDDRLAVACSSRTLTQFDPVRAQPVGSKLLGRFFWLAFSPDGRLLAATESHHEAAESSAMAYLPDDRLLAATYVKLRIFSADTGELLASVPATGRPRHIWFSADGQRLIACDYVGGAQVVKLSGYTRSQERLLALVQLLTGIEANPDGGFAPLEKFEIMKNRDDYRRAFRVWRGLSEKPPTPSNQPAPEPRPPGALSPKEAIALIGREITLEMTVASVGTTRKQEYLLLNSTPDFRDKDNFQLAIRDPSPERRKAMGFDNRPDQEYVGRRVRVKGIVSEHQGRTQIVIKEPSQLEWLPDSP